MDVPEAVRAGCSRGLSACNAQVTGNHLVSRGNIILLNMGVAALAGGMNTLLDDVAPLVGVIGARAANALLRLDLCGAHS